MNASISNARTDARRPPGTRRPTGTGPRTRTRSAPMAPTAIGLAALMLLSGCASSFSGTGTSPGSSIFDGRERTAKAAWVDYLAALDDIMELVEPSDIAEPLPVGSTRRELRRCGQFSEFSVRNGGGGTLDSSADPMAILDRIESHYSRQADWTVSRYTDDAAHPPRLRLDRTDGVAVYVMITDAGTQLELYGFSACFTHARGDGEGER